jgi:prolyl-tRNA editing enzyme YbaK/EbsC (Cys-tRNA(Pro) deacylase)
MQTFGTLQLQIASENPSLFAPSTASQLVSLFGTNLETPEIYVAPIDPSFSDTASFCENYQIKPEQCANCVIIEAKRGEKTQYVACVVLATTRTDVNGLARRTVDARKASFAPMEIAVNLTSMEYGAITPIGLPAEWTILVDSKVIESPMVVIGAGIRSAKLILPGKVLATLPNVQVLEGLGN